PPKSLLPEHVRSHWLIRPVDVGLRILLLSEQPVHHAGALGLLGVEHRVDLDSRVSFKVLQDRFRKNLVFADVDRNCLSAAGAASCESHQRDSETNNGFYCATRHGENCGQLFSVSLAHWTVLSVWHELQEFGIFSVSVAAGGMNLKVWLRTLMSAMVC